MPTSWTGQRWLGGRTYVDGDGTTRYVIERMRRGRRYSITVPPGLDPEAEYALWRRDPEGYAARAAETGLRPDDAVVIDTEALQAFGRHLAAAVTSVDYVRGVLSYLAEWANALRGRDLRYLRVEDLEAMLTAWEAAPAGKRRSGARRYRIVALQSFCTWLVGRQRLQFSVASLLKAPKARSARSRGQRAYTVKQVEAWYRAMPSQRVRDCLCLGAKYGMHQTEVARIARGDVDIDGSILTFRHKSGRDHRQAVDAQALAAVRRLMALGRAPSANIMNRWTHRVARATGMTPVHPKFLRHFAFTLGRKAGKIVYPDTQGGLPLAEMAALVGHRSGLMGKDHYDDSVGLLVLPLNLYHPEDPINVDRDERRGSGAAGA